MKGRQVNFFMNNHDLAELEEWLLGKCNVLFFHPLFSSPDINPLSSLVVSERENQLRTIYLCRKQDIDHIVFDEIKSKSPNKPDYWSVDLDRSPVIEFSRCYWNDNFMRRGRLYFIVRYYLHGELVKKAQDFLDWGDEILRWLRRKYTKENVFGFYIGPYTNDWVVKNNIELKQ